jgi:hypothetical protein
MYIHKYSGSEEFYLMGYNVVWLIIWEETAVSYVQHSPEVTEGKSREMSIDIAQVLYRCFPSTRLLNVTAKATCLIIYRVRLT